MAEDVRNSIKEKGSKKEVVNAEKIWLLMGKDYRISRSIRLQWFFEHLNHEVSKKSDEEITNSSEELEILSVLPALGGLSKVKRDVDYGPLVITPNTKLSFIGRQYRFVFCIDMSPSLATVDAETGNVLFDEMFTSLQNCFYGLVQPFLLPGSSLENNPSLHVTVLANTFVKKKECQVLVQGYCVNQTNIKFFLCQLKRKLQILEKTVADELIRRNTSDSTYDQSIATSNETSLFYIIRDGLFALQLLPDSASAAIVVVTDGVFQFEYAVISDALLQQIRQPAAVCSFLQVGTGYRKSSVGFGYVSHCALMQFIASATSGAYLARCPPAPKYNIGDGMNMYHKALFCWNFQRDIDGDKIDKHQQGMYSSSWADYSGRLTPSGKDYVTLPPQPIQTTNYNEDVLHTRIASVLAVRSREGYVTDCVKITKSKIAESKQIEVKLVLPWKEHVTIEYIAKSSWPLDNSKNDTSVVVNVSGPYDFLVDITSTKQKNHKFFRKNVLKTFEQTMKSLGMSDHLLVQLQLFPTHPAASKIPDTIAKGSPLFCMSQSSNMPVSSSIQNVVFHRKRMLSRDVDVKSQVLALQYGGKMRKSSKTPESQFANYWKSIITLDTRTLNKWFHVHRLSILPEHDQPLPSNLMMPTATDHYITVHGRAALTAFFRMLKEWCSFILLENNSYVKFMSRSAEERPYTFCMLRVTFKGLCIGVKMAFLGGTPGIERSKVVEDLKEELCCLTAQLTRSHYKDYAVTESPSKSNETNCLIFLAKQLEMILVKYDTIPDALRREKELDTTTTPVDYSTTGDTTTSAANQTPQQQPIQSTQPSNTQASVYSQYLFNQRWIWAMGPSEDTTLEEKSIATILETIVRQRLHEGFHFCYCNKGIITLVKEVQVCVDSSIENISNCSVIQYIVFPPHNKLVTKPLLPDDSIESDGGMMQEVDGPLQMATEVWVEPQIGTMDVPNCPLSYIHMVEYNQIPRKIFDVDCKIVSEISSYMLLHKACLDKSIIDDIPLENAEYPTIPENMFVSTNSLNIPFQFKVLPLLKKSRLIVSMYPMMKNVIQTNFATEQRTQNDILLSSLHQTLQQMTDHKIELATEEKKSICNFIKNRVIDNNIHNWKNEWNAPKFRQQGELEKDVHLSCYIKSFGSRLIIMFTMAHIDDLKRFLEPSRDDVSTAHTDDSEIDSQLVGRSHLPFFIFECEFEILRTIPSRCADYENDVLQDYTQVLSESALTPRHLNQKLPDDRSRELAVYCQALYDHYFWSLVSAVYNCLQNEYVLDREDVELSIELVCEESVQEINITNFIRTICSHYRSLTITTDAYTPDDIVFPDVLTPGAQILFENKPLSRLKKRSGSSGSSSQISSGRNSLKSRLKECENITLQEEIQSRFTHILEQFFHKVPNDPYYMFFKKILTDDPDTDDTGSSSARSSVSQSDPSFEDPDAISNSGPESDTPLDDDDDDSILDTDVDNDGQRPMFLHLTCSCHYKTDIGNNIRPLSITTLPTCLADILSRLDDNGRGIDPYNPSLQITLDLLCLTQPTEPEEGLEWKTPKDVVLTRQDSTDSFYSSQSQGSDRTKRARLMSQLSQSESYSMRNDMNDALEVLPSVQREAVEKTVKEIDWLLEDEIASALRTQGPVTEKMLDKVAKHVETSVDRENCVLEKRYFMFVTSIEKASDQCMPLFLFELESARLDRYELVRYGKYYCLVLPPNQEYESEGETLNDENTALNKITNIEDIKKQAQQQRKHFGHRRSQSDFTNNREKTQNHVQNEKVIASKSHSLPSLHNDNISNDSKDETNTDDVVETLWKEEQHDVNKPLSNAETKSISSDSDSDGIYFRRSMSYSEKDMPSPKMYRRRFSMPDINISKKRYFTKRRRQKSGTKCIPVDWFLNVEQNEELKDTDDTMVNEHMLQAQPIIQNTTQQHVPESQTDFDDDFFHPPPDFWLFTNITNISVDVYLHRSRAEAMINNKNHKKVLNQLLQSMDQICKIVNQRILLDNLYSTYVCNPLLIAEDDEKVWDDNDQQEGDILFIQRHGSSSQPFNAHVHGEYKFHPGFFQCDIVWETQIPIHSRLTTSSLVSGGLSKGLSAVRNQLDQFRVSNRQNLFVFRERDTKNVFYIRVNEGSSNDNRRLDTTVSPLPDDEHLFAPVREDLHEPSRASSVTSLINKPDENRFGRFEFERQESYQSGHFIPKSDDHASISETSLHQHTLQEYVTLSVYGIRDPGNEIKVDMVNMIKKKLDVSILALINQSLSRNPKCKLSPQDVEEKGASQDVDVKNQFIQPPGQFPAKIIHFCISNYAIRYLHATLFYLQQHLLQVFNTPRFLCNEQELHFKNYTQDKPTAMTADPIIPNDLLLYNRSDTAGHGVGIIFMNLVNEYGVKIMAQPYYPTLCYETSSVESYVDLMKKMLSVKKAEDVASDDPDICHNMLIEFKIWERGDIDIETLENDLRKNLLYALGDVFLEYHLFSTPISHVPKHLQASRPNSRRDSQQRSSFCQMRHSSGSSNATTPKLIKPHMNIKKLYSEPTTPIDMRLESPEIKAKKLKEDLSLVSESPSSFPADYQINSTEVSPEELEKKKASLAQSKQETSPINSSRETSPGYAQFKRESPGFLRKKGSREESPLARKRSNSSRTSSGHSDSDLPSLLPPDNNKQPTMNELNQMTLPVGTSYVMLTDAEVQESLQAVEGDVDKKSATWQEIEIQRRLELDKRKDGRRHEHGVTGELHEHYCVTAPAMFDEIISQGNTSLHKQTGYLSHQYPINLVIKEFVKEMHDKCPDITPKVYKRVHRHSPDGMITEVYTKHQERTPVKPEEDNETSMDLPHFVQPSILPNQSSKFIAIGHNSHKWLLSMGTNEAELSDDEEGRSVVEEQSKQRFDPLITPTQSSNTQERRRYHDMQPTSCITHTFVPRQKFFMAIFENKKITLYTYNYSSDIVIDRQFKRLYAWHNVRSHMNTCLFMQKLGLFHHKHFVRDCPDKEDHDVSGFASSSNRSHLAPLMKEIYPKAKEKSRGDNDTNVSGVKIPDFDSIFRDTCPSKPLHHCNYCTTKDMVKRQAYQYQDVRNIKLRIAHKEARLKEIYDGWKQEGAHVPITADHLNLLKRHSRLSHYCYAPIMFKIKDDKLNEQDDVTQEEAKEAGNSSDESDGNRLKGMVEWYEELKWMLIQQYIQYLQTLGLCVVQVNSKNTPLSSTAIISRAIHAQRGRGSSFRSSRTSNRSSDGKDFVMPEVRPSCYYLQKTSMGGIILIEVFFKKDFLCYKMCGYDSSVLRNTYISTRDQRHFLEDCNKFKDLTHLRSFTYDFHLRQLQDHLSGRHSVFQKGYPVQKLMEQVIRSYPKAPKFCRCKLGESAVSLPTTRGMSSQTLFKYLISNASNYRLSRICVSSEDDLEMDEPRDFVLTFNINAEKQPLQFAEGWRTRRDVTEYDGNVTMYFDALNDSDIINIPFFLVLRNRKEFYPRPHMLSSVSALKRRQRTQSGMEVTTPVEGEIVKQKVRVRFSGPNESTETIIPAVLSTGSMRRTPSWSTQENKGSLTSIRSSGSDNSLSRSTVFSPRSPNRTSLLNISPSEQTSGSPDSDFVQDATQRTLSSSTSTQENYLLNEQKFLTSEIIRVGEKLKKKLSSVISNCWRDTLWLELLIADDEYLNISKKNKRTKSLLNTQQEFAMHSLSKCIDDWKAENSLHVIPVPLQPSISFSQLNELMELSLVHRYYINTFDTCISDAYIYIQPGQQQQVIRTLQSKFGSYCRQFISDEGDITFLCILNPGNLNMFFLVEANETQGLMDFSVVYRNKPDISPFDEQDEGSLKTTDKNSRTHIELVISCLCFSLWQQMLPS